MRVRGRGRVRVGVRVRGRVGVRVRVRVRAGVGVRARVRVVLLFLTHLDAHDVREVFDEMLEAFGRAVVGESDGDGLPVSSK